MISQAVQVGRKIFHKPIRPPWYETLHIASLTVHFWSIATKQMTKPGETEVALQNIRKNLPDLPYKLPSKKESEKEHEKA